MSKFGTNPIYYISTEPKLIARSVYIHVSTYSATLAANCEKPV